MHTARQAWWLCTAAAVLSVVACGGSYQFETRARYQAPAGGFEIGLHAHGVVRSGADLSEESVADVRVTPLGATAHPSIELESRLPSNGEQSAVVRAIQDAGYPATGAELREVGRVVDGALRGPKATLVQGQTSALRVIETSFSYPRQ
jgi:hypothetical protein